MSFPPFKQLEQGGCIWDSGCALWASDVKAKQDKKNAVSGRHGAAKKMKAEHNIVKCGTGSNNN